MSVSIGQLLVGAVLVLRLVEFWVGRRAAEARAAAGEEEIAGEFHLACGLFHALWLAALAFLAEHREIADGFWLVAAVLLLGLRAARLATGGGSTLRVFRPRLPVANEERARRLMRDPAYLPMFAELMVLPLAFGLWWFALLGTAAYAALAWRRLALEGLR